MIYKLDKGGLFPLLFIICMMLLPSCMPQGVRYHSYVPVPYQWKATDTVCIVLPDSMTADRYHMTVEVRNTAIYDYSDLWLAMQKRCVADGIERTICDTLHLKLIDDRGRWYNESSVGVHYQSSHPMGDMLIKEAEYSYEFRFWHLMSDSTLLGISDIGIRLEK